MGNARRRALKGESGRGPGSCVPSWGSWSAESARVFCGPSRPWQCQDVDALGDGHHISWSLSVEGAVINQLTK